jgi:hypothetical protein
LKELEEERRQNQGDQPSNKTAGLLPSLNEDSKAKGAGMSELESADAERDVRAAEAFDGRNSPVLCGDGVYHDDFYGELRRERSQS